MSSGTLLRRPPLRQGLQRHFATEAQTARNHYDAFNAFVTMFKGERASTKGPLRGVTVGVKDNICTRRMPTTCSSAMLADFTSPFDATVVELLQSAGATIVGKTNCDEFGMGSLNVYSTHGHVVNPARPAGPRSDADDPRAPGGSSGGSAAAVAAGLCRVALGTDTGGSTRLPASYCGIVGFKPSYGLLSRWGVVSFADSLDCVGVMSQTVSDTQQIFDILSTYDKKDPTAIKDDVRRRASAASHDRLEELGSLKSSRLKNLRIGIPQEYFPEESNPDIVQRVREVVVFLQSRGAVIIPVSLPSTRYALSAYYVISSAEASSNLGRYDGIQYGTRISPPPDADLTATTNVYSYSRTSSFGPEVKRRILLGAYALTADAFDNYFLQAQQVRKLVKEDFNRAFLAENVLIADARRVRSDDHQQRRVDVVLHPSAIQTAPLIRNASSAGLDGYVQDVLTVPASLAGLPAISVPAGAGVDGWPVGVSIVGQWGHDALVLRVAEVVHNFTHGQN